MGTARPKFFIKTFCRFLNQLLYYGRTLGCKTLLSERNFCKISVRINDKNGSLDLTLDLPIASFQKLDSFSQAKRISHSKKFVII